MNYQDIVRHFGNVDTASRILGYTRMAIYNWRDRGVPYRTQQLIEAMTGSKLKAKAKK